MTTIVGIDPGLVHTGVVVMEFDGTHCHVTPIVIEGEDSHASQCVNELDQLRLKGAHIFIEAYTPRGQSYGTNPKMQKLLMEFRQHFKGATVLDNMGVKTVVKKSLMELLGVWKFSQTTHHQDLRSAARIGIFGALKDPELNRVLFDYVKEKINR